MDRVAVILYKHIEEQVSLLRDSLCSGRAKDFSDYQRVCGEIRGLLIARQLITDLVTTMERNDE